MKTIFTLMAVFMIAIASGTNGTPKESKHLKIEGKFLSQTNVQYDVYIINADSSLDAQSTDKGFRYFNVEMELNEHYLIKFTCKDEVKYLYVETSAPGTFTVDVDFKSKGSAKVYYHYGNKDYQVIPYSTAALEYAQR